MATDRGPGTIGKAIVEEYHETATDEFHKALTHLQLETVRQSRLLFDHSHPVDEYVSTPGTPGTLSLELQPTYDIPERIESILVVTPSAATGVQLNLGSFRTIAIGSGVVLLQGLGMVLTREDRRLLTVTAWGTGPVYFGLMGHASSRFGTV